MKPSIHTQLKNCGFSLTELLVAIVIVGILGAVALPQYFNQVQKTRQNEAATQLSQVQTTIAAFVDEVSMIASDQFLQTEVRLRQGTMQLQRRFGGLAMNVCGDFLQLPPVDKDGTRKSLQQRLISHLICNYYYHYCYHYMLARIL